MAKRPTIEHDLITWAETHLPQAVGFVRAQSGERRHKALARIFVRRFQVDRGWGNGFESWIEDMRVIHNNGETRTHGNKGTSHAEQSAAENLRDRG